MSGLMGFGEMDQKRAGRTLTDGQQECAFKRQTRAYVIGLGISQQVCVHSALSTHCFGGAWKMRVGCGSWAP